MPTHLLSARVEVGGVEGHTDATAGAGLLSGVHPSLRSAAVAPSLAALLAVSWPHTALLLSLPALAWPSWPRRFAGSLESASQWQHLR